MISVKVQTILSKVLLAALLALPIVVSAATVEGKVNGISCAVAGVFCPVDKLDPMVALETDFVVQQPDGSFYVIPNVDRAVKARLVLDDVVVTGDINDRYKTIRADEIAVKRGGEMKTVWTLKMQEELREQLFGGSQ
ncbi:MAG: hypothetical protein V2J55_11070 [Candidatus Competibacteraceae bacterium]|jgi:hypothetical protein|nr:hypothetical protein [Candidatus Competibacteraceae bacterium]